LATLCGTSCEIWRTRRIAAENLRPGAHLKPSKGGPLARWRGAPFGASELQQMPGHLIRRAHQVSTAYFAKECGRFDLTSVQFAALFVLRAAGELDATRLSELIAFDRSTIGDVVERLETKGWITRNDSADDKRIKLIRLTSEGAQLVKAVKDAVKRVQNHLLEKFSPRERAMLIKLLRKLDGLE
jgi:DNA-binding MarR family transcriptional regulator